MFLQKTFVINNCTSGEIKRCSLIAYISNAESFQLNSTCMEQVLIPQIPCRYDMNKLFISRGYGSQKLSGIQCYIYFEKQK